MTRGLRAAVFWVGAAGVAVLLGLAFLRMPESGGPFHPYRDLAVPAALRQNTANAVSSVNFDLRAMDTLGEELILLGSVIGAVALLRTARDERLVADRGRGGVLSLTRLAGYVLLPVTLLVGLDILAHGHLTPGGGFQGGVVLASGLHLLYVSGGFDVLQRMRPVSWYGYAEAVGAAGYVAVGLVGSAVSGSFLENFLPTGQLGSLLSAGTVGLLSVAVGCEVGAAIVMLLAQFLRQALLVAPDVGGR
jgi:multicomponent Na+:H+ antiporter subunit B